MGQAERADEAKAQHTSVAAPGIHAPQDKTDPAVAASLLVDVSVEALRMSSPFNAGYWLNAA
ncbi:hypothetical protein EDC62_1965 [Tibeticola sediminis]|jgi:hypothetical protein|uniref:Uncharacterized protein n=1 Tax=Tibeticola sediminis TaxID=1917811 RepID=A0A3N4UHX2_9BURK|nr:hypothetical protein [Tibeticola sediminis]RPE66891.1 hypothetical protein EDC62_1965 [Tibeticola sediminis]